MNFIITALIILYIIISGYGAVKFFLKDKSPFSVFGLIPLSLVAGLGLLAFWGNLIMLVRLHLSFWPLFLPFLPLFCYGLSKIEVKSLVFNLKWTEAILLLIIIFGIGSVFLMSVTFPLHLWDSRAIWGLKAKMLFSDGTVFSPNFMDPARVMPHFRYPLLFPLAQSFIYFALGQMDDWSVTLLVGIFFPLLVMFLYDLIRIAAKEREKALMGAALLAVLPVFYMIDGPAHSGYADTPLALFFLVSFGTVFLYKVLGETRLLISGLVLTAFLPLVKNEGALLLFLNFMWVVWPVSFKWGKENWSKWLRNMALLVILSAVIVGPWLLLRSNIPNVQEEKYAERLSLSTVSTNIARVPAVIGFFIKAFFGFQPDMMGHKFLWGGLWLIAVLAAVRAFIRRNLWGIHICFLLILFCAVMGVIYTIAPGKDIADIVNLMVASFFRVALSITPLAILLITLNLSKLDRD